MKIELIPAFLLRISGFVAAYFCILLGAGVLTFGTYQGVMSFEMVMKHYEGEGKFVQEVLKAVDLIFLGLVIEMLGLGLHELFVSRLNWLPSWLKISEFDQLKILLIKASITVVAISFVGRAVTWDGSKEIAYYGVGISTIIAALTYFLTVKREDVSCSDDSKKKESKSAESDKKDSEMAAT
ncbi:MAG: YqhA family protein [Planctomycetota bacterium]